MIRLDNFGALGLVLRWLAACAQPLSSAMNFCRFKRSQKAMKCETRSIRANGFSHQFLLRLLFALPVLFGAVNLEALSCDAEESMLPSPTPTPPLNGVIPKEYREVTDNLRDFLNKNPSYTLGKYQTVPASKQQIEEIYRRINRGSGYCADHSRNDHPMDWDFIRGLTDTSYGIVTRSQLESLIHDFCNPRHYISGRYAGPLSGYRPGDRWGLTVTYMPGAQMGAPGGSSACVYGWMHPGERTKYVQGV